MATHRVLLKQKLESKSTNKTYESTNGTSQLKKEKHEAENPIID